MPLQTNIQVFLERERSNYSLNNLVRAGGRKFV